MASGNRRSRMFMRQEAGGPSELLLRTRAAVDEVRLSRLFTQNAIERSRKALAETIVLSLAVKYSRPHQVPDAHSDCSEAA